MYKQERIIIRGPCQAREFPGNILYPSPREAASFPEGWVRSADQALSMGSPQMGVTSDNNLLLLPHEGGDSAGKGHREELLLLTQAEACFHSPLSLMSMPSGLWRGGTGSALSHVTAASRSQGLLRAP